jgi:hypothetical protein
MPRAGWRVVLRRAGRVLRFDRTVYADVARDRTGLRQAVAVVAIVAAAAALGAALATDWSPGALLGAAVAALLHWLIWTGVTYLVATTLVRGRATRPGFRRVLRVVGYAETPQVVALGGFLPVAGPVVVVLARLLALVAGHQALEEALGLDRRRTAATTAACFALGLALSTLVKARLGDIGWWQALLRP